jgi:hypothetical protein
MNPAAYPFSSDIIRSIDDYPEFKQSLKLYNSERFYTLHTVIISAPTHLPNDEVVGIFYYDKHRKIFVQDFIVKQEGKIIIHYKKRGGNNKAVKNIKDFELRYCVQNQYRKPNGDLEHHYSSANELPDPLQNEAKKLLSTLVLQ